VEHLVGKWFLTASVVLLIGAVSHSVHSTWHRLNVISLQHTIEGFYMYLLCNEHRVPTDTKASLLSQLETHY
jgi:hypothetical protein